MNSAAASWLAQASLQQLAGWPRPRFCLSGSQGQLAGVQLALQLGHVRAKSQFCLSRPSCPTKEGGAQSYDLFSRDKSCARTQRPPQDRDAGASFAASLRRRRTVLPPPAFRRLGLTFTQSSACCLPLSLHTPQAPTHPASLNIFSTRPHPHPLRRRRGLRPPSNLRAYSCKLSGAAAGSQYSESSGIGRKRALQTAMIT
jgi:hypothetical protein